MEVLISYTGKDIYYVEQIQKELAKLGGITVTTSTEELSAKVYLNEPINKILSKSDVFIPILTSNSLNNNDSINEFILLSDYVWRSNGMKLILPIKLNDAILPETFKDWFYIDYDIRTSNLIKKLNEHIFRFRTRLSSEKDTSVNSLFINRDFKIKEKYCFVLMPFLLEWSDSLYKHLKQILYSKEYSCERADDLYGSDVLEDIWIAINTAELIIADITSKNPNVFYEIGIAHTLGKKVILLTQSTDDIPFDFKRFRHIIYKDNTDGFNVLEKEIPKYLK